MAWAHVQSVIGADGTSSTATTVAITVTVTSGDFLGGLVAWDNNTGQTLSSVKDDLGNTATLLTQVNDTTDTQAGQPYYFPNPMTGGSRTITATFSATTNFRRIGIFEYSGIATSSPSDGSTGTFQSAPGTGANVLNSGNITTTAAGDLIVGLSFAGNANTYSAGTSPNAFTQRAVGGGADAVSMQFEDFRQTSAATIAATAGATANNATVTFVAAFKQAVASTPQPRSSPIGLRVYKQAPFLNTFTQTAPSPFNALTIPVELDEPIRLKPFVKAPFLSYLPIQVPPPVFTVSLAGLANIITTANASATVAAALSAQATTQVKARAGPSGSVPLAALATIQVKATGAIVQLAFLAGRATTQIKAAAGATVAAALSARATVQTKAAAAVTGSVGLSALATIVVKGAASISTGGFVALSGTIITMVKSAGSQTGALLLVANLTIQVKPEKTSSPIQPVVTGEPPAPITPFGAFHNFGFKSHF